jgi:hypothetical protein
MANAAAKRLERKRLKAAESVCWSLMLAMAVGGLDIPVEDRQFLADPMQKWVDLAVKSKLIREDDDD